MKKSSRMPVRSALHRGVKGTLGICGLVASFNQATMACTSYASEIDTGHFAANCMFLNDELLYGGSVGYADFTNSDPTLDRSLQVEHGDMSALANAAGRVRTTLFAGGGLGFSTPYLKAGLTYPVHRNYLSWKRTFQKTAEDQTAAYTLNERYLEMTWDNFIPGASPPYIEYVFSVAARDIGPDPDTRPSVLPVVHNTVEFLEIRGFSDDYKVLIAGTEPKQQPALTAVSLGVEAKHNRYRRVINLEEIPLGNYFEVTYFLGIEGGTYNDNYSIDGDLSDPLDVDGAIELETTAPEANVPIRETYCDEALDPTRYVDQGDGSAIDTHTGLNWQRCTVGLTWNNNGTPTSDDDSCDATGSPVALLDWRDALQDANSNTLGGHNDWRLPNVKELESLVAACSHPMIESLAVPSDGTLRGFWTATPDQNALAEAQDAWQVNAFSGDVIYVDKSDLGYMRLVRSSGQDPVAPIPALLAGGGSVHEGDSGTNALTLPIVLRTAAEEDVTVDYEVFSTNPQAIDGTDFIGQSGTMTFAPGELRKELQVTVYGDTQLEGQELIRLRLANPSNNARIAKSLGLGRIIDDEPVIRFARYLTRVDEDDLRGQSFEVPVLLDKPAAAPISVDYDLIDGSALIGTDVVAANGTLNFAVGEQYKTVQLSAINDTEAEYDERFRLALSNPVGATMVTGFDSIEQDVVIVDDDSRNRSYLMLNDTAIVECATADASGLACPQSGYPMQDAEVGLDSEPAGADDSDGTAGFSLTKLDDLGVPLVNQNVSYSAEPWPCVVDSNTGLYWEVKTPSFGNLPDNDFRSVRWSHTWYNSSGIDDGGDPGTENGGSCIDGISCDSEKYIAAVNAAAICGFSDWRLPTLDEYYSIVEMGEFYLQHVRAGAGRLFPNADFNSFSSTSFMTSTQALNLFGDSPAADSVWTLKHFGMSPGSKRSGARSKIRLVRTDGIQ